MSLSVPSSPITPFSPRLGTSSQGQAQAQAGTSRHTRSRSQSSTILGNIIDVAASVFSPRIGTSQAVFLDEEAKGEVEALVEGGKKRVELKIGGMTVSVQLAAFEIRLVVKADKVAVRSLCG